MPCVLNLCATGMPPVRCCCRTPPFAGTPFPTKANPPRGGGAKLRVRPKPEGRAAEGGDKRGVFRRREAPHVSDFGVVACLSGPRGCVACVEGRRGAPLPVHRMADQI